MAQVPSNLIPIRVSQLDTAPVASEDGLLLYVYQGESYKIRAGDLLQVSGVPLSRQVIAGTGLQGGGQLSSNVTLSIAPGGVGYSELSVTGVTPGVYGDSTHIPVFTVDDKGRITSVDTVPVSASGFVPTTRQVIAGTGLIGGGFLNTDVTLSANLSDSTPNSVEASGSAGVSTEMSRSDHKHPAIDVSNGDQVTGVLGLGNGGTNNSLSAVVGAVVYSGADALYLTPAGTSGQLLFSNGALPPSWGDTSSLSVAAANNISAGVANQIPYQVSAGNTNFISAPTLSNTYLSWDGSQFVWSAVSGSGTVTSVNASGGTTGLTFSGGPITSAGTLTLSGTLAIASGGTGATSATNARSNLGVPSNSGSGATGTWNISILGNAATVTDGLYSTGTYADPIWLTSLATSKLTGTITNIQLANSSLTINGSTVSLGGSTTVTAVNPFALTIGSGLSGTSYDGSSAITITNTAPDQIVSLTQGGTTTITGTYPNFTISSSDQYTGTVTSVGTGTGLSGGPITTSGTINFSNAAVGTWAATPSSSNLAAAMTDETGSGSLVFANSPTLSGPTIDGANPYIQFNNGVAVALAAGRMWYNGSTGSWNLGMGGGNITQQVGEELFLYGKASSAISDSPLQIIYQTGTVGASGVVTFAPTVTGITDGNLIVGIATEAIATNDFGRVTTFGIVRNITTDGAAYGEAWADGDVIWYNPVTGNPTKFKPSAPNIKVQVGTIINAGSGGSGSFQVEINHGSVLGGTDSNVELTSVVNNDLLQYYAVGGYWRNVVPSTITVGSATNIAGGAASQIPYQSAAGTTSFIANGTAGQVLVSAGAGTPTWSGVYGGSF